MKRTLVASCFAQVLAPALFTGCGIAQIGELVPGEKAATVWNLPYSASEENRRGVYMYYIDGKPISYTYNAASLPAGLHDIEVQCFICVDPGYAIDRHTIHIDARAGHQYQFKTRLEEGNHCDAWLEETDKILR